MRFSSSLLRNSGASAAAILATLVFALLPVSCGPAASSSNPGDSGGTEDVHATGATRSGHTRMIVYGMSCPLCATNVDQQLLRVPGVSAVSVDLGSGMIDVTHAPDQSPSPDALRAAIRESGFTFVRFDNDLSQEEPSP